MAVLGHTADGLVLVASELAHTTDAAIARLVAHTTDIRVVDAVYLTASVTLLLDPPATLTVLPSLGLRNLGEPSPDARAIGQGQSFSQYSASPASPGQGQSQFGLRNYRKPVRIVEREREE